MACDNVVLDALGPPPRCGMPLWTWLQNIYNALCTLIQNVEEQATIPPGLYAPFGGNAAPNGWLLCDGKAYDRVQYAELFAAIGTLWGVGDGLTTFNVPDLRGRAPVGLDNMGGTPANVVTNAQADIIAGAWGAEFITQAGNQVGQHNHPYGMRYNAPSPPLNILLPTGYFYQARDYTPSTDNNTAPQPMDKTMPSRATNYIIKY